MEKKDKPWKNDLKFNTSKLPNGPIKYYKPVPVKVHKPIYSGQLPSVPEVEEVKAADPAIPAEILKLTKHLQSLAVEHISGASWDFEDGNKTASGSALMHQQYGRGLRTNQGLDRLIGDFTQRYGRGLNPEEFGKYLIEYVEEYGHRYGYENKEMSRLRAETRQYSEYLSQSRSEAHHLKRELEALKTKMADMVPRAKPKVPRSFSCDGRKFKDA